MTTPPPVKLVLFDLDGTLVDSAPDIARALNATLAGAGLPPLPLAEIIGYVGDGAGALVRRALPPGVEAGVDLPALVTRFRQHYSDAVCVDSRIYPGVAAALTRLRERGTCLCVLTNKPGDLARALLRALALDRLLAEVIGDGDGFPRKPDPEAGRALLARHGVAPARALVVGDGLPDLRLGRALGCGVAAAAWGYTPRASLAAEAPDRIFDDPAELVSITPGP